MISWVVMVDWTAMVGCQHKQADSPFSDSCHPHDPVLLPAPSAGDAAVYKFPTSSREFLEANFLPAIFSALPFTWTEKNQLVGRQLSDAVEFQRTQGMSFEAISQQYNEQAARRVVDIIHTRLQFAARQQKTAAGPLQLLQAAAARAATAAPVGLGKPSAGTAAAAVAAAAGSKGQAAAAPGMGKAAPSMAKPPLAPQGGASPLSKMKQRFSRWLSASNPHIRKGAAAAIAAASNKAAGDGHDSSSPAADSPPSSSAAGVSPNSSSNPPSSSAAGVSPNSSSNAAGAAAGSRAASLTLAAGGAAVGGSDAVVGSSLTPEARSGSDKGSRTVSAAGASLLSELELLCLDPFDRRGFALKALSSQLAADIYMGHSKRQEQLQVAHMQRLPAGGHISLDHVHQVAKRMQGDFLGTLIACGASGVVLGFWHVHSTSMRDVQQSLKDLRERSIRQHGEVSGKQQVMPSNHVNTLSVGACLQVAKLCTPWHYLSALQPSSGLQWK